MNAVVLTGLLASEPRSKQLNKGTLACSASLRFAASKCVALYGTGGAAEMLSVFHSGDYIEVRGKLDASPKGTFQILISSAKAAYNPINRPQVEVLRT